MSEIDLMHEIQCKASIDGHRLWRNNCGTGWVGQQVRVTHPQMVMMRPGDVLLRGARVLHAGLVPGSSDLIGIAGDGSGRFIAAEVKAPKGRTADIQESFIETIRKFNGIGIIARTLEDFRV